MTKLSLRRMRLGLEVRQVLLRTRAQRPEPVRIQRLVLHRQRCQEGPLWARLRQARLVRVVLYPALWNQGAPVLLPFDIL